MIRRLLIAALDAGTLSRTVLVLSRQLDNAHLLAASEEARADRAELRVAELEAQQRDWAELSGELAAEQPADGALPDLTDAAPPPATPDPLRETDYQRDRADSLMRTLHATEAVVLDLRARLATAEREAKDARAQLQQTERSAGAHLATISALREQIAAAHRAAHAIAPAEQIPGVAAAADARRYDLEYDSARNVLPPRSAPPRLPSREALYAAVMRRSDEIDAAADDPPPTRPSSATRTT